MTVRARPPTPRRPHVNMFYQPEQRAFIPALARRPDGAVPPTTDYQSLTDTRESLPETLRSRGPTL
ncbi:hypothetical protein [Caecibacteroides pullorum]|uniref:Uncharacterized protein n=1 Tax=Caecibacteroides pullorum TaxID=2725562 RepID=A0AA40ZWR8_9BACT|nr:hypothetical protein [Caecibacteroides pullorum]MBM6858749.1 hypothetical protein [Caecibacteroides pullorum]MBV8059732.1 hypothetical protein [Caecibacteroides pullorum]